ncbi:DMT family transporter [Gaiella sp.]|jgi:drug/metabolite transporter (DMT)-like permease|uniref:DMT family transporter n=1 Tax=Gaiella sp. TaxID=2663207 RepID=UPI002B8F2B32|nr:DMT family transporter [Gaiella sp.]HWO81039.1 DMT family transporter [Gaiella sp.]
MQASAGPERRRAREGRLAILLAAVAWSTAGLGQRGLDASAVTQVAGRAFFAALALLALVLAMERRGTMRAFLGMGRSGLAMTVFLAISSGAFLLALNHTSVANVLFMQAAAPMMAALLGWVLISEPVDGRTWAALLLAGAGVAVMAAGSLDAGIAAVGLPLLMTASFAVVIVIARHRRDVSMMPATCASQVLVVVVCAPFVTLGSVSGSDWAILAALGVGQMGLGLAFLTIGARLIPPAQVALISLLEVVLGPLWVWLAYGERPSSATLVGGAIVVAAVVVQAVAPMPAGRGAASEAHV